MTSLIILLHVFSDGRSFLSTSSWDTLVLFCGSSSMHYGTNAAQRNISSTVGLINKAKVALFWGKSDNWNQWGASLDWPISATVQWHGMLGVNVLPDMRRTTLASHHNALSQIGWSENFSNLCSGGACFESQQDIEYSNGGFLLFSLLL
jgi:hypothetical protein